LDKRIVYGHLRFRRSGRRSCNQKGIPLSKALEVLRDEVIAVIGYGVQGPAQALNLRDRGLNVIVGQRKGRSYQKALKDGWTPEKDLFSTEEAAKRGTIVKYLLSDAGQKEQWPIIKPHLTEGKALYFSHGFSITYRDQTGVIPSRNIDVILVAPKGSGTTLRRNFLIEVLWPCKMLLSRSAKVRYLVSWDRTEPGRPHSVST